MATTKRIPLRLSGAPGIEYESRPVTFGIPFAEGELKRGAPIRITTESGTPIPCQTDCLATWKKDLEYVRWLLVDLQTDLGGGPELPLTLEHGEGVKECTPENGITVGHEDGLLSIDTGAMQLQLRTSFNAWDQPNNPDFYKHGLVKTAKGWHDVFRGEPGPFLTMTDQYDNLYDSYASGPAPRITVEETGPLRTCICVKGYHAMVSGPRFCPYILRIHLFAGKADMRIHHTFIFDQEPHAVELAEIGMSFPLALGTGLRAAVGGSDRAHWAANYRTLSWQQSDDRTYTVDRDGEDFGSGEKTRGWASLNGTLGGATFVVRNAWQEFPKGFAVDDHGVEVQIWPEDYQETLKFTTPFEEPAAYFNGYPGQIREPIRTEEEFLRVLRKHPTAPLNLKSLNVSKEILPWVEEMLEKHAPERAANYSDTGTDNGTGAAKTTEIYVRFSPEQIDDEASERLARAVQEPIVGMAEPEYACRTRAFGHFHHGGDPQFASVDQGLDDLVRVTAMEPIETCRLYGMMRYGNMVVSHAPGPGLVYLHYKDTEPEKALRYVGHYNNEANDQIMGVWGNFLRTGKREHYFLAQNYSRNVADVATIHAHPSNPNAVGLMHYHNCHMWSGGPSPSHTLLTGTLIDYFTSGNRRLLDVAEENAEGMVRTQEPAGIISCRQGVLQREFTGPLWSLILVYRATWKEKYGDLAQRSLNWLLRATRTPGMCPNSVFTRGDRGDEAVVQPDCAPTQTASGRYYLYETALGSFDSTALRRQIIGEADYCVWNSPDSAGAATPMACLAYELTGEMIYAAYLKHCIEKIFMEIVQSVCHDRTDMSFTNICYGSTIPRYMCIVADAVAKDRQGLQRTYDEWRKKIDDKGVTPPPARADKDPGTSLGVLSTEPLPLERPWQSS